MTFFDLHPVELARQITLLEQAAFLKTSLDEWAVSNWTGTIGSMIGKEISRLTYTIKLILKSLFLFEITFLKTK